MTALGYDSLTTLETFAAVISSEPTVIFCEALNVPLAFLTAIFFVPNIPTIVAVNPPVWDTVALTTYDEGIAGLFLSMIYPFGLSNTFSFENSNLVPANT